jgi:hypothetical protein
VGYLVVIPLWLILPGFQLRLLQIQNKVISFCLAGIIPTLNIFHTTEGTLCVVGVVITFPHNVAHPILRVIVYSHA